MTSIIKKAAELAGRMFSFVYIWNTGEILSALVSHIYTGFLKHRFSAFGPESVIGYKALTLRNLRNISIGSSTQIGKGIQLTAWNNGKIKIGNGCNIRDNAHITAANSITIGDNLLTGTNVLITDNSHGTTSIHDLMQSPIVRKIASKGPVVIGDNVWLGNNVCVMPGVTIGDGVVIGANSVVTKDIPEYSVAAGVPAKVISSKQPQ